MASDPNTPHQHPMRRAGDAPLGGTRSQAMQRLQIGLSGLAAMIVLVGLANIILDRAQQNEVASVPEAAPTAAPSEPQASGRDPLADVGVVPDLPASPTPSAVAAPPAR
jgi:hypothetical protein